MSEGQTDKTDEALRTHYCNAVKTSALAGGHGKSYWNKVEAAGHRDEMEARGIAVPSDEDCYASGSFNGPGSV